MKAYFEMVKPYIRLLLLQGEISRALDIEGGLHMAELRWDERTWSVLSASAIVYQLCSVLTCSNQLRDGCSPNIVRLTLDRE